MSTPRDVDARLASLTLPDVRRDAVEEMMAPDFAAYLEGL